MALAGHVLIGEAGEILEMDHGFTELLQSRPDRLRGVPVLDITAPADRDECAQAIARLRETARPFNITKRFLREDASLLWVQNQVSIMAGPGAGGLVVATCVAVSPETGRRHPAALLANARSLMTLSRDRARVSGVPRISETGWNAVVEVYIAEAEGRMVDIAQLAAALAEPETLVARWVALLIKGGVLEVEFRNLQPDTPKAYRLTSAALARLEAHLRSFSLAVAEPEPEIVVPR